MTNEIKTTVTVMNNSLFVTVATVDGDYVAANFKSYEEAAQKVPTMKKDLEEKLKAKEAIQKLLSA